MLCAAAPHLDVSLRYPLDVDLAPKPVVVFDGCAVAATGTDTQWTMRVVSREPIRGKAWKRAISPRPNPIAPLKKKRAKTFGCQ